jgi:hypothetical protein
MSRLPFDPSRVRGPEEESAAGKSDRLRHAGEAAHLTVSELSHLIKQTLEQRISSPLRVVGEISNLSTRNHWYFSLKDEGAVVSCVAWASSAKKFGFTPKDGEAVLATGHVSHYPPQGRTQLYVTRLEPRWKRSFAPCVMSCANSATSTRRARNRCPPFRSELR